MASKQECAESHRKDAECSEHQELNGLHPPSHTSQPQAKWRPTPKQNRRASATMSTGNMEVSKDSSCIPSSQSRKTIGMRSSSVFGTTADLPPHERSSWCATAAGPRAGRPLPLSPRPHPHGYSGKGKIQGGGRGKDSVDIATRKSVDGHTHLAGKALLRSQGFLAPDDSSTISLHPLQSSWCLWLLVDRQSLEWKEKMREVYEFNTVEEFWRMHHNTHGPSVLGLGDYYMFRKGIGPDWNDPVFKAGGGRFTVQFPSRYKFLDEVWLNVVLRMIGEGYEEWDAPPTICGAVAACRAKLTKIAIWVASHRPLRIRELGRSFVDYITDMIMNQTAGTAEPRLDLKPEFESFHRSTPLDCFFSSASDKNLVTWAEMQKVVINISEQA